LVDEQGNIIPKTPETALVAAQAYLHTTRLKMVGNKLSAKEVEAYRNTVLGTGVAVDDLEHHHQGDTKARSTEEPEDPSPQIRHTITKTTKRRWGHHALPIGFAPCQYPKVSNYLMISKNTTDLRSHSHGSWIMCKQ
jgi:hypothetical protein